MTEAANALRALHVPGKPLVLANVWDAASAKLVEAAGFAAIATSSGAVADSLGYRDGQQAPIDEMFGAVARICRVVEIPVSVDAEAGYGRSADEFVRRLVDTGAVGCNLEDTDHPQKSVRPVREQAAWLGAVRAAADKVGVPLVINARIDAIIRRPPSTAESDLVGEVVARGKEYAAAGADCVYPIGMRDPDAIRQVIAELAPLAVNVNPLPDQPHSVLADLGAARISYGTGLWREAQQRLADRLAELAAN